MSPNLVRCRSSPGFTAVLCDRMRCGCCGGWCCSQPQLREASRSGARGLRSEPQKGTKRKALRADTREAALPLRTDQQAHFN